MIWRLFQNFVTTILNVHMSVHSYGEYHEGEFSEGLIRDNEMHHHSVTNSGWQSSIHKTGTHKGFCKKQ